MNYMNRISHVRMMRVIGLLLLLIVLPSFGQLCQLSMTVSQTPVQQLSITDVDFQHFQTHSLLFTVMVANIGAAPETVQVHFQLNIHLADGTDISNGFDDNGFCTYPIIISPTTPLTFTNLDLGQTIRTTTIKLSSEAQNRVQDIALATGKFPSGQYDLALTIFKPNPDCNKISCQDCGSPCGGNQKDIKFDLRNPSRVDLRSPRDGEVTNEFPFFEFYQDGGEATLTVAELLPDQSREDALSHKPPMLEVDLTNGQSSFMYSGGRPLEAGKTYVWQVAGKSQVIGGTNVDVESPIWSFTVSNGATTTSPDAILLQLEQILGPSYKSIFDQIRSGGYKLDNATLNNSVLSQQDLLDLINALREISGSIAVSFE